MEIRRNTDGGRRGPGRCTILLVCAVLALAGAAEASVQAAPSDRLLSDTELIGLLDPGACPDAAELLERVERDPEAGLEALAGQLGEAFSQRYFFDWKDLGARFAEYRTSFPSNESKHRDLAALHAALYPARARWKLPFENRKGNAVTANEFRHLARQHKVLDMAFVHLYEGGDPQYVRYFTEQLRSLNAAFEAGDYEGDEGGNGAYESFRAGYRVMNWLQAHAFFLSSEAYGWRDQLDLVRTMLHTGAVLHEDTRSFRYGNHQTRGAVALAMIAILFRDFAGTDAWYRDTMAILGEHLEKEVNADGFQFERSVHYHIGDIFNFFQVLQLAQLNEFPVPEDWRARLKAMFDAAVLLARPDRHLPVLQDDTDRPWAEFNEMGDFMLLGSVLFDDPVINWFASDRVAPAVYWLLRDEQIAAIAKRDRKKPEIGSAELPDTGYYVMRDGWDAGDYHMVISAGLSEHKPDHQHGDMLGLVARANGQDILPNYQVRYSLPDYEYFKNSLAKNVAIVDGVPQGRDWRSNKGGSGFGKWATLPRPRTIAWRKSDGWDFFAGSHDGYANLGVDYHRKVLFIPGLGWIVRDLFESSNGPHDFQQVWQGHYSDEGSGNHHRSAFSDGSGLEILQLGGQADAYSTGSRRGKGRLVYTMNGESGAYTTLLYPFKSFANRIPDAFFEEGAVTLNGWALRRKRPGTDASLVVEGDDGTFLFGASRLSLDGVEYRFPKAVDLRLEPGPEGGTVIVSLEHEDLDWSTDSGQTGRAAPGEAL